MKKWVIGSVAIVLMSAVAIFLYGTDFTNQSHLANAAKLENQWQKGDIQQKAIQNMTKQLKQNKSIVAANATTINTTDPSRNVKEQQKFTGALQVQMEVKKGFTHKEQMTFGRDLLELIFANEQVGDISLSIFQNGDSQGFIKMIANKHDFKDRDKETVISGLSQLTMMNPASRDKG